MINADHCLEKWRRFAWWILYIKGQLQKQEEWILSYQSKYEAISADLDDMIEGNDSVWDSVAPAEQHQENIDMAGGEKPTGMYGCFNADKNAYTQNSYT